MLARIYQPARNAMQSGVGKTKLWVLEYAPEEKQKVDPLMGWTGGGSTLNQVRIRFESRDAAISYAEQHGIAYTLDEPNTRRHNIRKGGYGENFQPNRRLPWTH